MRLSPIALAAAFGTVLAIPTLGWADSIEDAIDARQGYYQVVKHNFGILVGMAKGEIDYDAEKATSAARDLEALSKLDNGEMWPQGSSNADRPGKTRALPVIWETFPAILDKDKAFKEAAATMAAQAGNGLDAVRANVGAVGNSCGGCHDTYRAKTF